MSTPRFSLIVPVYNRPAEVADLLASLRAQTCRDYEAVIVEDGSTVPCRRECEAAADLPVRYYAKENEGRSIARNYGIERSRGEWLVFVDSDVVLPPEYFETLSRLLDANPTADCYGGPDAAHASFTPVQKAINYAMTSPLTTGGIRGGKHSLERFVPRTFNMGFRRSVYDRVGGFREMFSEDIDMSMRIRGAGYNIVLLREAYVYHKRRVSLTRFLRQVYIFGQSRITLKRLYPGSLKVVHTLPAVALVTGAVLLILAAALSWWWLLPLAIWTVAILADALVRTRSLRIALLAVPASAIQIAGYGAGFLRALTRPRDAAREVALRKGR